MAGRGSNGRKEALKAAGAALSRAKGPLAAALASAAATAAAFVIFSENRPKFLSRRADEVDPTSPFADTPAPERRRRATFGASSMR
ncbi:MAG: hypothetical protein HZY79_16020 [Rhodoblastus sp.]|nr:MAG: hypothetical protein HZY79_16020 [Rhodoblastus sp.]